MLYQENNTFKVFSFKTNYEEQDYFLDHKEEFEERLKEQISMVKEIIKEEIELDLVYEEVSLTGEQEKKFNEIKDLEGITLDEVRDYVINNRESNSNVFKTFKLEKKLKIQEQLNADLVLRIAKLGGM